jgi:hypothetical protein
MIITNSFSKHHAKVQKLRSPAARRPLTQLYLPPLCSEAGRHLCFEIKHCRRKIDHYYENVHRLDRGVIQHQPYAIS